MQPVNRNMTRRARQALYTLKKEYGAPIDIYKLAGSATDVHTGAKVITKTVINIRRAAVLPVRIDRAVKQSISLISANKEFVTGGSSDVGTRDFIIDRRDTPTLPTLTADDWIVYGGSKYQITTFQAYEVDAGWVITAKELVGEVPEQIFNAQVIHYLTFVSTATAVVE